MLFLIVATAKNGPSSAKAILFPQKFILQYLQNLRWFRLLLDQDRFMGKV